VAKKSDLKSSDAESPTSAAPVADNPVAQLKRGGAAPSGKGGWREFVRSYGSALLLFLVLRTFFVEAFRIPSGSMIPTMLVGDWLFVNKLRYGPNLPFTDITLPGYAEPARNDIVVFKSPTQIDQPEDPNPILVKRLKGMPGDTVYMRDGVFHVNGVPDPQTGDAAANPVGDPNEEHPLFAWQGRFVVKGSRFGEAPARPTHDNWGPLLIPPGFYFMLGDNRYQSKDGRYWGLVPREHIRGRPLFVYYSFNQDDSDRILPFITDIRWGRIGHWYR
jgi:signal peptidase I